MNILLETGLPEEIDGLPIYADFRNMIRFELILQDEELSPQEKTIFGLSQLFETIPTDIEYAIEKLLWFYMCGRDTQGGGESRKHAERAYDFEKDSSCIYSAFYAAYGISLTTLSFLHWWEFMALLESLPETTQMAQLMRYRTMDLSKIKDKTTRTHYANIKKRVALETPKIFASKSVEEITRLNKERVAKRFETAKKAVQN
ncbi:MAG: bacteriophage Gp15 family protein [Oscillospiraceae bacterium]